MKTLFGFFGYDREELVSENQKYLVTFTNSKGNGNYHLLHETGRNLFMHLGMFKTLDELEIEMKRLGIDYRKMLVMLMMFIFIFKFSYF